MPGILLPILYAVTAAAGVASAVQQRKAGRQQKRALREEQKQRDIEAARSRVSAIREARRKRAQVIAASQARGVADSAGAIGAVGGIQTQLGANLSFMDQIQQLTTQANIFRQGAVAARGRAATYGAVASVTGSIFDIKGGFEKMFETETTGTL